MPTLSFRTAVLLAAVSPLGFACPSLGQFAENPVTVDTTNSFPSGSPIVILPTNPTLTYTNADGGTLFNGIQFRGDVTIINEAGATGLNDTGGGIGSGIFQTSGQAGTLEFINEGLLNGSVGTSNDPAFGGDDSVTLFTTGEIRGTIDLGVGNDIITLTGGEADSAPDAFDGDRDGFLLLNGVRNVETLVIEGDAALTGDDIPIWQLFNVQNELQPFTNGVRIGETNAVAVFQSGIIRGDVETFTQSIYRVNGIVDGNLTVRESSTFAPNTSASVTGDFAMSPNATFEALIDAAGNSSRLFVEGNAALGNATLEIIESGQIFGQTTTATILVVDGTIAGNFGAVTTDFSFLDAATTVSGTDVIVTLTRNGTGISNDAATENQRQAGLALEVIDATADPVDAPANQTLADAYAALGTAEAQQAALESLSGEPLANAARSATNASRGFSRGMDRRSRMMQVYLAQGDFLPSPQLAARGGVTHDLQMLEAAARAQPKNVSAIDTFAPGFWVDVLSGKSEIDSDDGFAGVDTDFYGLIGGFDIQASNEWIMGVSVGYTSGEYDVDDRSGSGDLDTINLGAYTAFIFGNWRLNGGVGVSWDDYEPSRRVTVGTFDQNASADFEGLTYSIDGTATYRVDLGGDFRLEPFGTIEYFRSRTDDYSETGAGAANLTIEEQDFDALYTTLGVRLHRTFLLDRNAITPEVRAGWQHEWLDTEADATARFLNAGVTGPIKITGVDPDDDAALLGAGITADFNRKFSLRLDYDTRISSNQTDQQVTLSLRIPW